MGLDSLSKTPLCVGSWLKKKRIDSFIAGVQSHSLSRADQFVLESTLAGFSKQALSKIARERTPSNILIMDKCSFKKR
jgi:hypothetical protein